MEQSGQRPRRCFAASAAGGTYFDTAFVCDGGKSEAAFKEAVVDRYPRDATGRCAKRTASPWT